MAQSTKFSVIVALTRRRGIGYKNDLPWPRLAIDMKRFVSISKSTTDGNKKNAIIMGKNTWNSIPTAHRPLAGRFSIVITNTPSTIEEIKKLDASVAISASSFMDAYDAAKKGISDGAIEKIFVIGGAELFRSTLLHPDCETIFATQVLKEFPCDTFMPSFDSNYELTDMGDVEFDNTIPIQFLTYSRIETPEKDHPAPEMPSKYQLQDRTQSSLSTAGHQNEEEMQYLRLIKQIMDTGVLRGDRTGTGTKSLFGTQMRFSLRDGTLPLFTTKRVYFKGVAEELLWFIQGSTDSTLLDQKGVKIWNDNGSRETLDKLGFQDREIGDLGPVYGFQWRHFGAEYVNKDVSYSGQGYDQLADVIRLIRTDPNSRRILLSSWNPKDLNQMALPPCHVLCQFYVADGELSCILYQRSCDIGLGVPFNVASYSLLTHMIAHITGLKPGDFIHFMGDTHIYLNHMESLVEQISRTPTAFPKIKFRSPEQVSEITDFTMDNFEVLGYNPQKSIFMKMAI